MAGESRKRKVGLLYDERMCKHDTPRELFKKASEEKKLLEGRVLKLEAELQKDAS
ncbi:hypothetical protein F2Q69_00025194 [Brassica cretica]|uniref:Uncharacterized protein n=1 Tax=Brassica cretica TaxID=69181 RepID=A0A8S9QKT5_BRACR|nr:hypothetical protein F2Q69_00025194 [Brassica cretica]